MAEPDAAALLAPGSAPGSASVARAAWCFIAFNAGVMVGAILTAVLS